MQVAAPMRRSTVDQPLSAGLEGRPVSCSTRSLRILTRKRPSRSAFATPQQDTHTAASFLLASPRPTFADLKSQDNRRPSPLPPRPLYKTTDHSNKRHPPHVHTTRESCRASTLAASSPPRHSPGRKRLELPMLQRRPSRRCSTLSRPSARAATTSIAIVCAPTCSQGSTSSRCSSSTSSCGATISRKHCVTRPRTSFRSSSRRSSAPRAPSCTRSSRR